ncbi:MAG: acyltransferase [Bacillota bacterium]
MSSGRIRFSLNQSMAISVIRIISTLMIIACHIFQGYDHMLAWWFNVGVQVFLFMSGFLVAQSSYKTKYEYVTKRFQRILITYWILLLLAIPLYHFLGTKVRIPASDIPLYITGTIGIRRLFAVGLDHLWFLAVLVICYFVSMFLHDIKDKLQELKAIPFYLILALMIGFLPFLENISLLPRGYAPWVATFILGFVISYRYRGKIPVFFGIILTLATFYTTGMRIYNENFTRWNRLSPNFVPWSKFLLGSFIFVALYLILQKVNWEALPNLNKVLKVIDSYTYETYLTHQIVVLGPLSLLYLTASKPLNILIILAIVTASAIVLKWLCNLAYDRLLPLLGKLPLTKEKTEPEKATKAM